ncbi:MAG: 30S ribosomal protein S13 [Candidatus Marinimicrobia bacterium]|nr:30S ribosomal protein S13 [Candidatus Neomarinimicrobiota bacterium]MCF7851482.1 30S ribosomal protein S13 [Candidatus Neomarinimicrobiota bacterium]MCF7904741.1 30S ribosomal protein S13 [Candidatus Neomarinimicrobiota bacterium]
MARIAGVDLPRNKKLQYGLTYIYGIGYTFAGKICEQAGVDPEIRVQDLNETQVRDIRDIITKEYRVEGTLRNENQMNIKRLMDIGCYRGLRHRRGMPVRGQNTKNNARTRKGRKRNVGIKKG